MNLLQKNGFIKILEIYLQLIYLYLKQILNQIVIHQSLYMKMMILYVNLKIYQFNIYLLKDLKEHLKIFYKKI